MITYSYTGEPVRTWTDSPVRFLIGPGRLDRVGEQRDFCAV